MLTHFLFTILDNAQSKTFKKHARFIGTIFVLRIPDPRKNIYSDIDRTYGEVVHSSIICLVCQ